MPSSANNHPRVQLPGWLLLLFLLALTACSGTGFAPPRLATATVAAQVPPTGTPAPVVLPAPTATSGPEINRPVLESVPRDATLDIWINETSAEHEAVLQEIMDGFSAETGVNVALRLVSPSLLPELVNTAVISDTLPDVILHPLEYSVGWAQRGILDPEAAEQVLDSLDQETFAPEALALVDTPAGTAALPSDACLQLWLYRQDWFTENNLAAPETFDAMFAGAEALFDPAQIVSGLVVPTESNLVNTQRVFEQIALANGCQLIDEAGEVRLLDAACRDALEFYFSIINQFSPPGVQTDTSARNAFLDGRTAIIMTSPSILSELAAREELLAQTGFVTAIAGDTAAAQPVSFANIRNLGITTAAETEAATAFADYWFNEGYERWLAVDSERKVPMRRGTSEAPERFIAAWGTTPVAGEQSLTDIVGPDTVAAMRDGVASSSRWGFDQGQGALITELYEELTFSVVLQEMLSGYFDPQESIYVAIGRVIDLIPNYAFPIEPTPTPEP